MSDNSDPQVNANGAAWREGWEAGKRVARLENQRFQAAVAAMQGLLASDPFNKSDNTRRDIATEAVHQADALLRALEEGK